MTTPGIRATVQDRLLSLTAQALEAAIRENDQLKQQISALQCFLNLAITKLREVNDARR